MMKRREFLAAILATGACRAEGQPSASPRWTPLLADIHRRTFDFFWEATPETTGLTPDRWPSATFSSVAAIGFALTAYCIGANCGYVGRAEAAKRTATTLQTLWNSPQGEGAQDAAGYQGFFYHFLNANDGLRYRKCELSNVDTAMLFLGALTAAAYFDAPTPVETEIRRLARVLYERADWRFFARRNNALSMGWHPETGLIPTNWEGYCEGKMIYLLALASPTFPLPAQAWQTWCSTYDRSWGPHFGTPHLGFAPLFGHQYTEIWYDMRDVADAYMRKRHSDYFINSRLATQAQRQYAILNPHHFADYGPDIWGLTACDGPADVKLRLDGRMIQFHSYSARGPRLHETDVVDDGTIAPTAALASIPFAPEIAIAAAEAMRAKYGDDIYGRYGFYDSFNPTFRTDYPSTYGHQTRRAGWVATDYLGIDQGPILAMLENYRSGFVWNLLRNDPYAGTIIRRGLIRAGFRPTSADGNWLESGTD